MTPKEKAIEIVIKMQFQKEPLMFEQAKQCALIAVDELIEQYIGRPFAVIHWVKVKQEIEKL
jgi:hypothetical protein